AVTEAPAPAAAAAPAAAPPQEWPPADADIVPVAPVVTAAPPEEWVPPANDAAGEDDVAPRPLVMLTAPEARRGEDPAMRAVRQELTRAGVHERYLEPLLDGFRRSTLPFAPPGAALRDVLRDHIAARMPVVRDWKGRGEGHTVVLVGQSGVGKTTTACKLAGRMASAGLRVALIAAGPGPHHALEDHARRLGVDAILCEDADSLVQAREALADRDLVIVDTAGRSHKDLAEIEALARLVGPAKPEEVHLVLPVAAALTDLGDVARRFRLVGVNRVTVTKLDETRFLGNLVNFPLRIGKPLGYLADGAGVPGALAPAAGDAVAELLLP
ncbi:MAG: hypothetical protein AB1416_11355, partial [Actinomycetota bacterium]